MKINRRGVTRIVLEFKRFVIKVPNFTYSWLHFLKGMIANINEKQAWKYSKITHTSHLLAPVICGGSFFLVMKRADVKRHRDEIQALEQLAEELSPLDEVEERYKEWKEAGYGGDDKCDNYGYIHDKLVKIDYGQ